VQFSYFWQGHSLTVAARTYPNTFRAIRVLASRARQQAITNQRPEALPHGRGSYLPKYVSRDTCASEPRASASDHGSEGERRSLTVAARTYPNTFRAIRVLASRALQQAITDQRVRDAPSRSRLVPTQIRFVRYVCLRAARVSKRPRIGGETLPHGRSSYLPKYVSGDTCASEPRASASDYESGGERRSLTVAARTYPNTFRAIRVLASRARQQAIKNRRVRDAPSRSRLVPTQIRFARYVC